MASNQLEMKNYEDLKIFDIEFPFLPFDCFISLFILNQCCFPGQKKMHDMCPIFCVPFCFRPFSAWPYFVKTSTTGSKSDIVMFYVRTAARTLKDGVYSAIQMIGAGSLAIECGGTVVPLC